MGRNKYFLGKGPWPGGWGPFPVRFIERGDAGLPAAMHPYSGAGNAALAEAMRPPFSFRSCRKENGPRPVQKKRTLRRVGPRRRVPPAAGGGWLAVSRFGFIKRDALGESFGPGMARIPPASLSAGAGLAVGENPVGRQALRCAAGEINEQGRIGSASARFHLFLKQLGDGDFQDLRDAEEHIQGWGVDAGVIIGL